MEQSGVVIIGASTAGLFAAYLMARDGIPVQVYDEREPLGQPSRTLIVTGKLIEVLGFVPHQAILNRVDRIELVSANQQASVGLRESDLVIDRGSLVELLAKKASEEGAEIHPGFRFLGFEEDREGLALSLQDLAKGNVHHITTKVLIGADGVLSNVAKVASRDSRETVSILQAKVIWSKPIPANRVTVWFDRRRTEFFIWLIPESESRAAMGLISRNGTEARESLEGFVESQGCEIVKFEAAQVPLHSPLLEPSRTFLSSRILLIGDAGGQVKATTVGGVVAGLRGARAAARAIMEQMPYGKTLRPLKRELDLHAVIRAVLNRFKNQDYDRLLELLDLSTRNILAAHNRDELGGAFFRLLLNQPRLMLLAAKALVDMRDNQSFRCGGEGQPR